MFKRPIVAFSPAELPKSGTLVVLAGEGMALGEAARRVEAATSNLLARAADAQGFKGKRFASMMVALPSGLDVAALVVVGLGDLTKLTEADWSKLGGVIAGALPSGPATEVTVFAETPTGPLTAEQAADVALGLTLRSYTFDIYKTKKNGEGESETPARAVTMGLPDPSAGQARWAAMSAVADGVILARDLVNEPPNVLGPVEFADRVKLLEALGVAVTILEPEELERLEMRALLAVAQGSVRPARVAIMEWNAGGDLKPVAFVGKGVVFDTGGISIKPAAGMEDMKGDMAGAAAVVGTMHALAARKAKVNAVGIVGLVENMPDGNAQRPGDIVRSKSGQTIEIINTDAEGRLVLADLLTYTIERWHPRVVVDLATLTGAIVVALGHHHAGLYSDDDTVAAQLGDAGKATADLVWRMPLGKDYDQLIDSKVADMKNTGGRYGGSITAAQFLKRFAGDSLWVHLDVAGTAMGAPNNEVSRTFGSGFGVRLLDRFVADFYEEGADAIPRVPRD